MIICQPLFFNDFLKLSFSQSLQQVGRQLDIALKDSFKKIKGFPKFKKKSNFDSFTIPQCFKINNKIVKLPKIGKVKWKKHRKLEGKPKFLIVGGGIANFTDVAKTFTGIIQAVEDYADKLKKTNVKIYVRRGGPNYKEGLENMRKMGKRTGLPVKVYGPETHMTRIVNMALEGK